MLQGKSICIFNTSVFPPELELVVLAERDNSQGRHTQQGRDVGIVLVIAPAHVHTPIPVLTLTSLHRSALTKSLLCQRFQ